MGRTHAPQRTRLCRLEQSAGRARPCAEAACPFWEPGGAALEGRCAFEGVDFERRPELAVRLLVLRARLESPDGEEEAREARALFLGVLDELASR
jgi:hypothetical protein